MHFVVDVETIRIGGWTDSQNTSCVSRFSFPAAHAL